VAIKEQRLPPQKGQVRISR